MTQQYKFVIPGADAAAKAKFEQFKAAAVAHLVAIGYDVADLDEILAAADDFGDAFDASELAKDQARNATGLKRAVREASTEVISEWAERIKTNPSVTPAILAAFGIEVSVPVAGPVVPPADLSAFATSNGAALLKWKRNGNIYSTTYTVEASADGENWSIIGTTTKTRFVDVNATPGVPKFYRTRATRAGITSLPSGSANIYPAGGSGELQIAA